MRTHTVSEENFKVEKKLKLIFFEMVNRQKDDPATGERFNDKVVD